MTEFQKMLKESLENQTAEMKAERELKEKKQLFRVQMSLLLFELTLSITGFCIIISHLGWWVGLGIWLMFISNNLSMLRQVGEDNWLIGFWKKMKNK